MGKVLLTIINFGHQLFSICTYIKMVLRVTLHATKVIATKNCSQHVSGNGFLVSYLKHNEAQMFQVYDFLDKTNKGRLPLPLLRHDIVEFFIIL